MIIIGNITEIDDKVALYSGEKIQIDKAYGIVRNKKDKFWLNNLEQFAPSNELYAYYLKEKRNFRWTEQKFKEVYLPRYINEIKNLKIPFSKNENIFLGCFCENEKLCHRMLLGCYLQLLGYEVASTSHNMEEYMEYTLLIKNLL